MDIQRVRTQQNRGSDCVCDREVSEGINVVSDVVNMESGGLSGQREKGRNGGGSRSSIPLAFVLAVGAAAQFVFGCSAPEPGSSATSPTPEPTVTPAPCGAPVAGLWQNEVGVASLVAFHRSGQTFLTWPEDPTVSGESYCIYRSSSPISASSLSTASCIARIPENSGQFNIEIQSGDPYQSRFIIQDLGPQLPEGVGLHVHTTHEESPQSFYYAITEIKGGVEQALQPAMTLKDGVMESRALPCPVKVYTNGVKTLYTHWMDYSSWNPAFEGYAYNFWVGIPREGNAQPLPLQMHLHAYGESWQRNWSEGDGSGSGTPYNVQTVWIEPDDNRNTWWYGFGNNVAYGEPVDTSSTIINYTEQRLLYYLSWLTSPASPFKIDTNRVYVYGGSMGGSGALSFGLRHPEIFAGVFAIVPMTDEASSGWGRPGLDTLWGTPEQNLPTNEGVGVADRMNTRQYLLDHSSDEMPYTITFHGRNDTIIEWPTQGLPWIEARTPALAGGPEMWANSDHSNSFDPYLDDLFANWPFTNFTLRHAESYLVFTDAAGDDNPTGAIPACRGPDPYAYGWLGNAQAWASSANPFLGYSAPVDTPSRYETALRLRSDQCNWPSSGAATLTIRRAQAFHPPTGAIIHWENRTPDGALVQSGDVVSLTPKVVTIPAVQISTAGSILTLTFSSGGVGNLDKDMDGVSAEQGDCDDENAAIRPGVLEVCDGLDNNCDGQRDEGVTQTFYADSDGDGYGGTDVVAACQVLAGYVARAGDCDDHSAGVFPGALELCDGLDNDCDSVIDETE